MNHGFKLKYDEMRQSNPAGKEQTPAQASKAYDDNYPEAGHVRNLCFVWQDGKRMFLNYSYLVSGEYVPDENSITVIFTSHTLVLKGVNLESLFYDIMQQVTRQVTCTDERYNLVGDDEKFIVNSIEIKQPDKM